MMKFKMRTVIVVCFTLALVCGYILYSEANAGERYSHPSTPGAQALMQNNLQFQGQGQGQGQKAYGGDGGAGGLASSNNSFVYDGDRNPVNSAFGYAPPPTADCQAVFGAGGQGINIGLSISGSYDDSECNKRAWAAWLMSVKREKAAIQVSCTSDYVRNTDMCTGKEAPTQE